MEIINYVLINYRSIALVCGLFALAISLLHLLLLVFLGFDKYPYKLLGFLARILSLDIVVLLFLLIVKLWDKL